MTHACIPDFSVPMPSQPARAVTVVVEQSPISAPLGRFPGTAAAVTILSDDDMPVPAERGPGIAGDALAAFVLIVGGGFLIGWATLL